MVIARIFGGLGNQLFCYAAARRLALVNGVPLRLDARSGFVRDGYHRRYLLDRFAIPCQEATIWESFMHLGGRARRRTAAILNRMLPFERRRYVEETQVYRFDPQLLDLRVTRPTYLIGYWQSEKYFVDVADTLRQDLTFRGSRGADAVKLAEEMRNAASVSIHLRSYSEVTYSSIWHSPLSIDYYIAAAHWLAESVREPIFYCFSDDLEWARGHLRVDWPVVYVDVNLERGPDGPVEDLWLMSQCRHHIISTSTFGWWGAWLGEYEGSLVVAPEKARRASADYLPDRWHTI